MATGPCSAPRAPPRVAEASGATTPSSTWWATSTNGSTTHTGCSWAASIPARRRQAVPRESARIRTLISTTASGCAAVAEVTRAPSSERHRAISRASAAERTARRERCRARDSEDLAQLGRFLLLLLEHAIQGAQQTRLLSAGERAPRLGRLQQTRRDGAPGATLRPRFLLVLVVSSRVRLSAEALLQPNLTVFRAKPLKLARSDNQSPRVDLFVAEEFGESA